MPNSTITPMMEDETCVDSVLYRYWVPACAFAWVFFIVFEILMGCDNFLSEKPLCPFTDWHYKSWYWYVNYSVLGAFIIVWSVLFLKIIQSKPGNERVPSFTAFNIVSMGTVATILAVIFGWGGTCIDVLGVASPAAIWGEWCACGPLLIFIVVTLVDKQHLSNMDIILMASFFICLITGFFIIIPSSYAVGAFWLTVSCVTYLPLLYLPWYSGSEDTGSIYTMVGDNVSPLFQASNYKKRFDLSMVLTIVLPLYTVNYLVAFFGGIDAAQTIAIYQVLSILTKGLFAAVTMDVHLDFLIQSKRAVLEENDRRTNEARRAFLKYIFHEVRSPLNSLSIGIEVLERSRNLDDVDIESLEMMRNASEFMSDTLNDVLSMQKIEEGKLELDLSPFCISDAISKVFCTFRGAVSAKQIELVKVIDPLMPVRIVGDRYRIEHVIANLLSNAIKFSNHKTTIQVNAALIHSQPGNELIVGHTATIRIAIKDEGPGISEENQKKLFGNFVQIRPGQLQEGRGSGLGLSLCKQLVHLHGGSIGVVSEEGHGSEFFFVIPFKVHTTLTSISANVESTNIITEKSSISTRDISTVELFAAAVTNEPLGVLIVDDAESNRKMLKMLLKKHNVFAETADNGKQAVDMVLAKPQDFQLVFMDNLMPVMNGVEATKLLREGGYNSLLVGVTGNVLEDDIKEYLDAGADLILGKPMKINVLLMLLQFIDVNGVVSRKGYTLVEHNSALQWCRRV